MGSLTPNPISPFSGKVMFITGGASGIGLATAEICASRGASIAIVDLRLPAAESAANLIREKYGVKAISIACNVADSEQVRLAVEETVQKLGGLHGALNAAGQPSAGGPFAEYPLDDFRQMIDVHLCGAFYCIRYEIAAMLKCGGGSIVNISSVAGTIALGPSVSYIAAKHGVVGLTKAAAAEYSRKGVRVNAVAPGFIKTPLLDKMAEVTLNMSPEDASKKLGQTAPIGRVSSPSEVGEVIAFLLSDQASFVTGSTYNIDGGYLAVGNLGDLDPSSK
ncbi:short-chain dehydrogenase/reductase SDR [Meredithblackwellia eburnea MCA 4105]